VFFRGCCPSQGCTVVVGPSTTGGLVGTRGAASEFRRGVFSPLLFESVVLSKLGGFVSLLLVGFGDFFSVLVLLLFSTGFSMFVAVDGS
jgi:hypothetical protein